MISFSSRRDEKGEGRKEGRGRGSSQHILRRLAELVLELA